MLLLLRVSHDSKFAKEAEEFAEVRHGKL